jgi:hypothetical protein
MPIDNISEKELQSMIGRYMQRFFYIEMEVWSTNGKRRIDIAMIHKTDKDKFFPIGIEIKKFDKKTGADAGKWLHQAQDYSSLEFIGYGKMLIIVAPQFSENVFSEGILMHKHLEDGCAGQAHNVSTFLGQFNLGEFQRYNFQDYIKHETKKIARIVYNGLIIWDERNDSFRPQNIHR